MLNYHIHVALMLYRDGRRVVLADKRGFDYLPWHTPLVLLLLSGALVVRLPLLALTAGYDLHVVAALSRRAAHGQDVYTIDPHHLTPWAYFPLLLDLFAGLTRLAARTGWSFYVLAKLPVVAADLGVGALLYAALRRRGHSWGCSLTGMVLYLYNPLVLYNGAFYGRFDAIALVFLLLALEGNRSWFFAPSYALAIASKTFPLFLLPLLALGRDREAPRRFVFACVLVVPLSLPYVVVDPGGLLSHVFYVDRAGFGSLSWYLLFPHASLVQRTQLAAVAHAGLALYPAVALLLVRAPLYVKAGCCYALFTVLTSTLYEQYLLWPLPFLIVTGLHHHRRGALLLVALYTLAGMAENEYTWFPGSLHYALLPRLYLPLNIALAVTTLAFIAMQVHRDLLHGAAPSVQRP